jgi:hypothetical protein
MALALGRVRSMRRPPGDARPGLPSPSEKDPRFTGPGKAGCVLQRDCQWMGFTRRLRAIDVTETSKLEIGRAPSKGRYYDS